MDVITTPPAPPALGSQSIEFNIPAEYVGELLQFGFYNDVTENLGQSWETSAATYDNVVFAETEPPSIISIDGGYIQLDTTEGIAPSAAHCAVTAHNGRMVVDDVNDDLYICTNSGWKTTPLD